MTKTTAPVAMNGFACSGGACEPRTKNIAPNTNSMTNDVVNDSLTSGARVIERKEASAIAVASCGTAGISFSRKLAARRWVAFASGGFFVGRPLGWP